MGLSHAKEQVFSPTHPRTCMCVCVCVWWHTHPVINVGSRGGWQRAVCEPACGRMPSATIRRTIPVAECDFIYSLVVASIFGCIHGLLAHCRAG